MDPDKRDVEPENPSIPVVAAFIKKHFNGIELKPSIVERCLYTVSYIWLHDMYVSLLIN